MSSRNSMHRDTLTRMLRSTKKRFHLESLMLLLKQVRESSLPLFFRCPNERKVSSNCFSVPASSMLTAKRSSYADDSLLLATTSRALRLRATKVQPRERIESNMRRESDEMRVRAGPRVFSKTVAEYRTWLRPGIALMKESWLPFSPGLDRK